MSCRVLLCCCVVPFLSCLLVLSCRLVLKYTILIMSLTKGCISKEIERPHIILLTDVMKCNVGVHATLFQLKRKGIRAHQEGQCVSQRNKEVHLNATMISSS